MMNRKKREKECVRARREKDEGRDETGRGLTRPRNRGSGMIDRVDRSKGMETLITEDLTKIKPTDLTRLSKDTLCRNRN